MGDWGDLKLKWGILHFALEQGGQRSQHLANQIINTMMIIFSKICCHHRIDALMGLTGLTSGLGSNQPCVKKGFLAHLRKRRVKNKNMIEIEGKKCACRHSRKGRGTSPWRFPRSRCWGRRQVDGATCTSVTHQYDWDAGDTGFEQKSMVGSRVKMTWIWWCWWFWGLLPCDESKSALSTCSQAQSLLHRLVVDFLVSKKSKSPQKEHRDCNWKQS